MSTGATAMSNEQQGGLGGHANRRGDMFPFWHQPETTGCPGPRAAHSCDVVDNKLVVFGGWNGKKALNDLHVLNVHTGVWTEVPTAPTAPAARNNHTTAVIDSLLFVHGGHDGTKWVADMHVLDCGPANLHHYDQLTWQKPVTSGQAPSA